MIRDLAAVARGCTPPGRLARTVNGLMAVPNLSGLPLPAPVVFKVTRESFKAIGKPLA